MNKCSWLYTQYSFIEIKIYNTTSIADLFGLDLIRNFFIIIWINRFEIIPIYLIVSTLCLKGQKPWNYLF